jgi:hypothetical protein
MTTIVRSRAHGAVSLVETTVIIDVEAWARGQRRGERGAVTRADGRVVLLDACAGSIETDGRIAVDPRRAAPPMATRAAGC